MNRPLILIVDDESKIRRLVAQNLELEGFDVQTASDGNQALEVLLRSPDRADLILLDLMMPEMDGMEMLKRLRKFSDVPVIILSAKDERPTIIEGFREGADDFVAKPFYIEELLERIRAVLRRGTRKEPSEEIRREEVQCGPIRLLLKQRRCIVREEDVRLTDREFRLLLELMRHPEEVLTHEHLLCTVWGDEYRGEVQYLRVTFARIRKKFEKFGFDASFIAAYSSVGYILTEPEA